LKILVSVKFTFKIYIKNNIGKIRSFLEKNVYLKTSEPTCNYHLIIFTKFRGSKTNNESQRRIWKWRATKLIDRLAIIIYTRKMNYLHES